MLIEKKPMMARWKKPFGMLDLDERPDGQIIVTHVSNDDVVAKRAADLRRETDRGWTKARHFKHVAHVPVMDTIAHPELVTDERALARYLKTARGSRFKVSDP